MPSPEYSVLIEDAKCFGGEMSMLVQPTYIYKTDPFSRARSISYVRRLPPMSRACFLFSYEFQTARDQI